MEEALQSWEDEGGRARDTSVGAKCEMTGTINQVDWARQIKTQVNAEFDRVAKALELAASKQAGARSSGYSCRDRNPRR